MNQLSGHDAGFLYSDTAHSNSNVSLLHIYDQSTVAGGRLRFNPHRNGEHGEELYRDACEPGLEGVIAKRADSPYRSGGRAKVGRLRV